MKTRMLFVALTAVTVIAAAQNPGQKPFVAKATDTGKTARPVKSLNGLIPYTDIIKGPVKTEPGFFKVHILNNKYYFEIPDTMLNRDVLIVNRIVNANAGSGYFADDQVGTEKVIRFKKAASNKLTLHTISYAIYAGDSTAQMFRAVSNSNVQPVTASLDIKSLAKDGNGSLVEVTDLLMSGNVLGSGQTSLIASVRAFPSSIEITASRTVGPPMPMPGLTVQRPNTGNGGVMDVSTSLILLPKIPAKPRYADERIGYFTTGYSDFYAYDRAVRNISLICRWNLQPKAADMEKYKKGILVEPTKPIIFYIDPATPKKWVPWLKKAVSDWQPAFEKAGFKNAIVAREAPSKSQDSLWSLESCPAAIVYKPSTMDNAFVNSIQDPRSGEIVQTRINWHHNIINRAHDLYMVQAGPSDPEGRKMLFNDELMGQIVCMIASREVGHALGLQTNLAASSTVPVEKLRDKSWLEIHGQTPSIMDNAWFNYVAQPEDKLSRKALLPGPGDYDKWAIEWGYRLLPAYNSAAAENDYLHAWVKASRKDNCLWLAEREEKQPFDPRVQAGDLGDDPIKASEYGIKNLKYVLNNLLTWTNEKNQNYDNLADVYHEVLNSSSSGGPSGQFSLYILHVLKTIGAMYKTPGLTEDSTVVFQYVSKEKQKAAVAFLNQQLFTQPSWLSKPEILSRTGDDALSLIGGLQNNTLSLLFGKCLQTVYRSEADLGNDAYTASELLEDVKQGVWGDLDTQQPIDIYKRRLQNMYVYTLNTALTSGDPGDLQGIVIAHFMLLQDQINKAMPQVTDTATKYHLMGILAKIDRALKNK